MNNCSLVCFHGFHIHVFFVRNFWHNQVQLALTFQHCALTADGTHLRLCINRLAKYCNFSFHIFQAPSPQSRQQLGACASFHTLQL